MSDEDVELTCICGECDMDDFDEKIQELMEDPEVREQLDKLAGEYDDER